MKKLCALIFLGWLVLPSISPAIDLKQAKFTQVVNRVEVISPADKSRHAAGVNEIFKMPDVVRTGPASRAELVAADNTITRVGADTIFSFDASSRTIDLQQGSLLFHSPTGKGGGTIHTGSATASVLGTTIIVCTTPSGGFKVLVLEGQAEIHFLNGQHLTLLPGQMTFILPGGGTSPIVVFRLDDQTKGSSLVSGFNNPLPSWSKIQTEITRQLFLLLHNKVQDTNLEVGDNATPEAVQVRMDLQDNSGPLATDSSIVGADHTANQTLPVNYPQLDPAHVENASFSLPAGVESFNEGLLFLGIINPSSGFVGRNLDIDTAAVDLSSFANKSDFDFVAKNDLRIWQSVNFTPAPQGGGGDGGEISPSLVSSQPGTIGLFAGGQMLIAPGSTLEADTGIFGLVAGSFGTLDMNSGTVGVPNTLENVSVRNSIGDVDILSLSDLTIEGMNCGNAHSTIYAGGSVNIQSDGSLNFGLSPAVSAAGVSPAGSLKRYEPNASIYACGDVALSAGLGAGANLNVNSAGIIAGGLVNLNAFNGDVNLNNDAIHAYGAGDSSGNVNVSASGAVNITSSSGIVTPSVVRKGGSTTINAAGSVTVNAGAGLTVSSASISANACSGTIELDNASGQATIENGSSLRAFYLNVNSPDGILIDGSGGGRISGNTMSLAAAMGNSGGGSTITLQNENLASIQNINISAHTVNLDNLTFARDVVGNFTSFFGGFFVNDGHQAGYVNFNNDYLGCRPITTSQPGVVNTVDHGLINLVSAPSSAAGLHVVTGP